ncbi:EYxxD motif small membrane protein [Robertmurraya sp. DFI.2.37]
MFWEYITDMSFLIVILIGSIVALCYAFIKKSKGKHVR